MGRRKRKVPSMGPLERRAMDVVWAADGRYLTPRQVADGLGEDLAYTTVTTLLTRLTEKGLLSRRRRGRAWAYRARTTRTEHAALAMLHVLDEAEDHPGVLMTFIGELSPEQHAALRAVVEDPPR